jgi:hypothetical protein
LAVVIVVVERDIDEGIILKWIWGKYGMKVGFGFMLA